MKKEKNLRCRAAQKAVHHVDAEDGGSKPGDHGQEGKGLGSTPLPAHVAASQREAVAPSPRAATPRAVEPVDEQPEDGGPASGEDYIAIVSIHLK